MPERPTPDPFSLALGRIEGRLDGLEKRLDERFNAIDLRFTAMSKRIDDFRATLFWAFGITWTLIVASGLVGGVLRHAG